MSINRNGLLASTDVWRSGDYNSNLYLRENKPAEFVEILNAGIAVTWTNENSFTVPKSGIYLWQVIVSIGNGASLDPSGLGYGSFTLETPDGTFEHAEQVLPIKDIWVPTTSGEDAEYRLVAMNYLYSGLTYTIRTSVKESAFANTLGTDGYIDSYVVSVT